MNCNGDNNDAAIFWGKPLPLDSGQVYALKGMFMVALRDYILPGTERGPNPAGLLAPRIITFTRTPAARK